MYYSHELFNFETKKAAHCTPIIRHFEPFKLFFDVKTFTSWI